MGLVLVESFPVGPLGCNFSLVADEESKEALLVDPGDDLDAVLECVARNGLKPVALLHTHAHFDHIGVSARLSAITGAPILLHEKDVPLYENLRMQGSFFGMELDAPGTVHQFVSHGDRIACGKSALEVVHTPGHTPGSVCFHLTGEGTAKPVLFSGDTLFRRSIGRTDLWGGSLPEILASIRDRLFTLPGDVLVLPGHGDTTTVAEEARLNPFAGSRAVPLV